jgi:hypothetical protein
MNSFGCHNSAVQVLCDFLYSVYNPQFREKNSIIEHKVCFGLCDAVFYSLDMTE